MRDRHQEGDPQEAVAPRALTFDLDDTLWPFAPVAEAIQTALRGWLSEHAPGAAAWYEPRALMALAVAIREERADLVHDLGALHRLTLQRMLADNGDDPGLADALFEVTREARQQMRLHEDAAPALDRLAGRFPILAVTNGDADPSRVGLDRWFAGYVHAHEHGVAKPDPRLFHIACERLGVAPADVLHVGDDLALDVEGALAAGMQAAWVHRDLDGDPPPGVLRVRDLTALADALLGPEPDRRQTTD